MIDLDHKELYCSECGYTYLDIPYDQAQHAAFHARRLQVLTWPAADSVETISDVGDRSRILKIDSTSGPQLIRQAVDLVEIGRREHGYDSPLYAEKDPRDLVFIRTIDDRAASLVILEKLRKPASWLDLETGQLLGDPVKARFGLRFLWTDPRRRRQRIARDLIDAALVHLGIPVHQLAWQWPLSNSGLSLATSYAQTKILIY